MAALAASIPAFVISLPGSLRRREVARRLEARGIGFAFVDAIDGTAMTAAALRGAYDEAIAYRRLGRRMTAGEVGCALSHRAVYARMVRDGLESALVFEDDADPSPLLAAQVAMLDALPARVELVSFCAAYGRIDRCDRIGHQGMTLYRAASTVSLSCAYFLRLGLARRFLAASAPIVTVADWPLGYRAMGHFIVRPGIVRHEGRTDSTLAAARAAHEGGGHAGGHPRTRLGRLAGGMAAVSFLRFLAAPDRYDGLGNYIDREVNLRLKARLPFRYADIGGADQGE